MPKDAICQIALLRHHLTQKLTTTRLKSSIWQIDAFRWVLELDASVFRQSDKTLDYNASSTGGYIHRYRANIKHLQDKTILPILSFDEYLM